MAVSHLEANKIKAYKQCDAAEEVNLKSLKDNEMRETSGSWKVYGA